MSDDLHLILSCEHGGNRVPEEYAHLFADAGEALSTHRGWDIGILPLARRLSEELGAAVHVAETTRLLVDLNRSLGHRTLFSEYTASLSAAEKEKILADHYYPYRRKVEEEVARTIAEGRGVLHLSLHSFTPELRGKVRRADLGLLYDPRRPPEKEFCLRWQKELAWRSPRLRVKRNYPYRGVSDSLVSSLHRRYPPEQYLGIELEVNQSFPEGDRLRWEGLQETIVASLRHLLP